VSRRDVQATLEQALPSFWAFQAPVRSCVGSRWPQALVQNPQAVPCEEARLGSLAIPSRPALARGERVSGGPVRHARLTELERLAGPSAPYSAAPHLVTSFRALKSVPSSGLVCASLAAPRSLSSSGFVMLLETGSDFRFSRTLDEDDASPGRNDRESPGK